MSEEIKDPHVCRDIYGGVLIKSDPDKCSQWCCSKDQRPEINQDGER